MPIYSFSNGPAATTAAQPSVTTGTAIKTMLQVKGVTALLFRVVEWGISFDGSAAAQPIKCELLETGTVFATVTAAVAADINPFHPGDPISTTYFAVGTTSSGYTASAEGTITTSRGFDLQLVAPTNQYVKQFPLGREPIVNAVSALRIRVTAPVAVNCYCYCILEA